MNSGKVYVIYNEAIRDPESKELLYKIGYTKSTVNDRYYGIGLKMPGKFEILFAYKLENCIRSERIIHDVLNKKRVKGEWFKISQKELDLIKNICETMGGEIIADEIGNKNTDEICEIDKIFDDNYKDESYENIYIVKEITCKNCLDHLFFASNYWNKIGT